ncbi:glycerol-3-phosphate dehydrogenase/oxidase [Gemmatimonas sp.]|jgi:glycerol-3-phosphate dehydrogenase|uniref:glycerol-3-phosphate dehydrogenase/oxidase n=1 Tax=Gemmatimonas sp. TaxID=1962908 RepID=UPI0037BF3F77
MRDAKEFPDAVRSAAVATRQAALAALAAEPFDMLIVGGGITGAGIAREAALAGFRTALLERDDFASGTSSRSSRLVHGGVRYLEHGHIGLVFESSRERRLLLELAPHLVRPLAFTWPVYQGARVPLWKVRAGLTLYDALSLFRNARHRALNRGAVLAAEPALSPDGMVGGARYWDAATDDSRLTLASALAAREAGASLANHVTVVAGIHANDTARRLTGVVVEDRVTGATFSVQARVIINATGPWSDATAALTGSPQGSQLFGSAGAHIAVPRSRVGNNDAVTIVSPLDGRVMFVLPAGVHTIIGTTERPAQAGPDDIRATRAEVTYLLQSVNRCFPFAQLTLNDVVSAWCGIRPLAAVRAGEHSANAASREHAITHRADGLVSITGGKLTTYRAMAADVLAHARNELPKSGAAPMLTHAPQPSASTPLPGGDIVSREATMSDARRTVHDAAVGERLALAYGSRWRNVWSYVQRDASLGYRLSDELPYLLAEVAHAVEREMAATLSDVLVRRTHVAFETRDNGRAAARRIAPLMATLLQWSEYDMAQQLEAYDRDVVRLFTIDDM